MLLLALTACLYDRDHLDWIYTQLEDDDGDGYAEIEEDCNDKDASVHPGADEYCDGVDNNCNGETDLDALDILAWHQDNDRDGYGGDEVVRLSCEPVKDYVTAGGDCNEDDPSIHPEATITCGEAIDRDCDGHPEDEDNDRDQSPRCEDCNDYDPQVNPSAAEECNQRDDNCDGTVDETGSDVLTWYPDSDGDGYGDDAGAIPACDRPTGYTYEGGDCDDHDRLVNPSRSETCGDGVDNNCNGSPDGCRMEGELGVDASVVGDEKNVIGATWNTGDWDGDGADDLGMQVEADGAYEIWVVHGPFDTMEKPAVDAVQLRIDLEGRNVNPYFHRTLHDVTGDGTQELAVPSYDDETLAGATLSLSPATSTGSILLSQLPSVNLGIDVGPCLAQGDLDGDGIDDLVVSEIYSGIAFISSLYATPLPVDVHNPTVTPLLSKAPNHYGVLYDITDMDGDGIDDLIMLSLELGGPAYAAFFGPVVGLSMADATSVITADENTTIRQGAGSMVADFDRDGVSEIVAVHLNDDGGYSYLMVPLNPGRSDAYSAATAKVTIALTDSVIGQGTPLVTDLDQDGWTDIGIGEPDALNTTTFDPTGRFTLYYGPIRGNVTDQDVDVTYNPPSTFNRVGATMITGEFQQNMPMGLAISGADQYDEVTGTYRTTLEFFDPAL